MEDLLSFDVDPERGFLPPQDPLTALPAGFDAWEEIAAQLPKLFASDHLRSLIENLPQPDLSRLKTSAELERAMMLLSYLGHGYTWTGRKPPTRLPASIA